MELQNLQWKIHLEKDAAAKPQEWFRAFGTWIPDSPEIFVDVADYSHVEDGPVILLAGHQVNYSLDGTDRRLGLLYDRRQLVSGTNAAKLKDSLIELLRAAMRLEGDAAFSAKPMFLAGDLKFVVNNRALAPNTEATFAAVKTDLMPLLALAYDADGFELTRNPDPKQRFSMQVRAHAPVKAAKVLSRLQ